MDLQPRTAETPNFSDICSLRRSFYLFFSAVFAKEATEGVLADVDRILSLLKQVPELSDPISNPDMDTGMRSLVHFQKNTMAQDALLEKLARHYARLFLGVGGKNTVFLCESSYRGDTNSLFQSPYFSVKERYASIHLQKDDAYKEPDDHLALELAFMVKLCDNSLAATPGSQNFLDLLKTQKSFIHEHLGCWVPELTLKLKTIEPESFYTACALLLNGFLRIDAELIDRFMPAGSAE
jgi:TorA maturation chaperone TorD